MKTLRRIAAALLILVSGRDAALHIRLISLTGVGGGA